MAFFKSSCGGGSYVGMIIHSTTLDTEAKVIAQYGGTTWIQHSGYMLRGGTNDVTANSATKTGGNDGAWLMKHKHVISRTKWSNSNPHVHMDMPQYVAEGPNPGNGDSNPAPYTDDAGTVASNNTTANIPNYKSVYIWERTA